MKFLPQKVQSVPFLEHLAKLHLDLCSLKYNNSPQVSCLGMNPGRGWNPNLEESYLLEYSESEVETFTQGTSGIYVHLVKCLAPYPSPISRYSECTKMASFSLLGFLVQGQIRV